MLKRTLIISEKKAVRLIADLAKSERTRSMLTTHVEVKLPFWLRAKYAIKSEKANVIFPNSINVVATTGLDGKPMFLRLAGKHAYVDGVGICWHLPKPANVKRLDSKDENFDWEAAYNEMATNPNIKSYKQTKEYAWFRNYFFGTPVPGEK